MMPAAYQVELLKLRRARVPAVAALGIVLAPAVAGVGLHGRRTRKQRRSSQCEGRCRDPRVPDGPVTSTGLPRSRQPAASSAPG